MKERERKKQKKNSGKFVWRDGNRNLAIVILRSMISYHTVAILFRIANEIP